MHSKNPKTLGRFCDFFFPARAKDGRRDARVLADALQTDPHVFRSLAYPDPQVLERREYSRLAEDLTLERTRLANRLRGQL